MDALRFDTESSREKYGEDLVKFMNPISEKTVVDAVLFAINNPQERSMIIGGQL